MPFAVRPAHWRNIIPTVQRLLHREIDRGGVTHTPDVAVTTIEAVPRFACLLPPQPVEEIRDPATSVLANPASSSEYRRRGRDLPAPAKTKGEHRSISQVSDTERATWCYITLLRLCRNS